MRTTRLAVVLSATAAFVLLLASPAFAHVSVHSTDATSGGTDAEITFRVPNELGNASTTKVEIHLPTDKPLVGVLAAPKVGWKVVTSSEKLKTPIVTDDGKIDTVVTTVTWTAAAAGGAGPGQYDDFDIAVAQLPKTDSVVFKVIQTYSNGSAVPWIELKAPGSTQEPEHPAPELALGAATNPSPGATPTSASKATVSAASGSITTNSNDDSSAKTLAGIGLGVGILALLLASAALLRRRTSKP
jgi:uncharacterized protein YcnI